MYLNTLLVNRMEEMCFDKKMAYHAHRMFERGFQGYGHQMNEMDMCEEEYKEDQFYKKYDLSKLKDHVDFEICLGAEFLNMDLSILDMKHKKRSYSRLINSEEDDSFMKAMIHRYRGQSGQHNKNIENDFDFKVMRFERNLQVTLHNLQEIFIFQNMLNCSPLVNEWLSFAKKHKINIDNELKDVISFIEQDKGNFKLYESLMVESRLLKRESFALLKKSHFAMRKSYGNEMFSNHIDRQQPFEKPKEGVEIPLIQEMDDLQLKIQKFSKKIQDITKSTNTDYFNEADVAHNNNLLIEGLFAAYQKLKHKISLPNTQSRFFINILLTEKDNPKSLEGLIERHKNNILFIGENIKYDNKRYQKVIVFTDATCIVLADDQSEFEIFANIKEFKNLVKTCLMVYVKNMLKKNPSIGKVIGQSFCNSVEKNNNGESKRHHQTSFQFDKILLSIDTYFKHENILKSLKYDFMETCKKATSFEKVDDDMHKLIREHKIKKFAESIISSKYKNLYNKESYKLFEELYDLSIDTKTLQEMLGKKLAAVENKKMFNENIKKLINNLNEFDMESVKIKANAHGVKIISEEKDILILEIENFVQSQKLGSTSWCISRNQSYFEQYTEKGGKQYFIYDFNQESKSVKSLIGVTLTKMLKVKTAHSKSDSHFKDKTMLDYVIEKVKALEVVETPPVAVKRTRKKKVVAPTDIALLNIGF